MAPPSRQPGVELGEGAIGTVTVRVIDEPMVFGFASYLYTGSLDGIGKVPVFSPVGRLFVVKTRFVPLTWTLNLAVGQVCAPVTTNFVVESQVVP